MNGKLEFAYRSLGICEGKCEEMQEQIDALKAQREALLAALDVASEDFWGIGYSYEAKKVDQAIAKARGEQHV